MKTPFIIATRGSALALAQAHAVQARCQALFPELDVQIRIIKTTGDQLQTASVTLPTDGSAKGFFTKELEVALLAGEAHLAVHSLKDLPTELPDGLTLAATGEREDVRDVLIARASGGLDPRDAVRSLPPGAVIATSSTRRAAQMQALRPDLKIIPIRGNVGTRLKKTAAPTGFDATLLALAGMRRLQLSISPDGGIAGRDVPPGLLGFLLPVEQMLPCVGQAAIGLEIRLDDSLAAGVCAGLNHADTFRCTAAERAFLRAMGGGCLSPVAAYAQTSGPNLRLRAVSFRENAVLRADETGPDPAELGRRTADLCR